MKKFIKLLIIGAVMVTAQTSIAQTATDPSVQISLTSVQVSVSASGTQPFTYQWYRNGVAMFGETKKTLSITNQRATGTYYCEVKNSAGKVKSPTLKLATTSTVSNPDITIIRKVK